MQKRNVLHSPRLAELKNRRHKALFTKIFVGCVGFIAILIFLVYLSRLGSLNISTVAVAGNQVIDSDELVSATRSELAGKYLWIFPKSNILYYSESALGDRLKDKFKRISSIDFSIKDNKTLEITLSEREPKYTWCGADLPLVVDVSPKCYFMDEAGYIFDTAPYFSGEVYFKFYGMPAVGPGASDSEFDPLGARFFGPNFSQIVLFRDAIIDMGVKPVALYLDKDQNVSFYLSRGASLALDPKILLKSDTDFQNAAENLQAALGTEPLHVDFKKKYQLLQYIDLRFGNKVYYRF